MTLQEFETKLKAAVPESYRDAAPSGKTRFAVWHSYGGRSIFGNDRTQMVIPKVQIDILTQEYADIFVDDVCAALWSMGIAYDVISESYDPDYAAIRTILQMVVV